MKTTSDKPLQMEAFAMSTRGKSIIFCEQTVVLSLIFLLFAKLCISRFNLSYVIVASLAAGCIGASILALIIGSEKEPNLFLVYFATKIKPTQKEIDAYKSGYVKKLKKQIELSSKEIRKQRSKNKKYRAELEKYSN